MIATLVGIIGTLLLAIGIGVLIGRSGTAPPPKTQVVSVVSTAPTPAATAAAPSTTAAPAPTTTTPSAAAPGKGAAAPKATAPKKAPPAAVKVGSPGSGPGFQKGKFTGNFFGQ